MASKLPNDFPPKPPSSSVTFQEPLPIAADLRSSSIPAHRFRAQSEKYDSFRTVRPTSLGHTYFARTVKSPYPCWPAELPAIAEDRVQCTWTKKSLYDQAQRWPREHRSHRDSWGSNESQKRKDWWKELARECQTDESLGRWEEWRANEEIWWDSVRCYSYEGWEERFWGEGDRCVACSDPCTRCVWNTEEGVSEISEEGMWERWNEGFGELVDQAVGRWEGSRAIAKNRWGKDGWEVLSVAESFDIVSDGEWSDTDNGWVED